MSEFKNMACPQCGRTPYTFTTSWKDELIYFCNNKQCKQGSYFGDTRDIKKTVKPDKIPRKKVRKDNPLQPKLNRRTQ
jgi:hypothetical protein